MCSKLFAMCEQRRPLSRMQNFSIRQLTFTSDRRKSQAAQAFRLIAKLVGRISCRGLVDWGVESSYQICLPKKGLSSRIALTTTSTYPKHIFPSIKSHSLGCSA